MKETLLKRLERVETALQPPKTMHIIWPVERWEQDNPPQTGEISPGNFHWMEGAVPEWVENSGGVRLRVVFDGE